MCAKTPKDGTQHVCSVDCDHGSDPTSVAIDGVRIPDSKMAQELREMIRHTETDLLFNHSTRVYFFGALTGKRRRLRFDHELLYVGAMFHDIGLTERYQASANRFEVDSANAARDFLRSHGIPERDVEAVWDAVSLHTTPGIPEHKQAEVALLTSGVEMDVMGLAYEQFTEAQRNAVLAAYPRGDSFKNDIIGAFYNGMKHRPNSTFGTVNDDVLAYRDPHFQRVDFCKLILQSPWSG
ncbi:HD domain-containing protein [Bradyrhizobium japonicum]|nr:HD domain-containing protein [Bradyrhizobium japonicum]